jgi:hypothetical protein
MLNRLRRRTFTLTALLGVFVCFAPNAGATAKVWASGTWGIVAEEDISLKAYSCDGNPLSVTIDMEKRTYTSSRKGEDPRSAKILFVTDQHLIIKYFNETRKMDNGEPHVWIMDFHDAHTFSWVRQDWVTSDKVKARTLPRVRCDLGIS